MRQAGSASHAVRQGPRHRRSQPVSARQRQGAGGAEHLGHAGLDRAGADRYRGRVAPWGEPVGLRQHRGGEVALMGGDCLARRAERVSGSSRKPSSAAPSIEGPATIRNERGDRLRQIPGRSPSARPTRSQRAGWAPGLPTRPRRPTWTAGRRGSSSRVRPAAIRPPSPTSSANDARGQLGSKTGSCIGGRHGRGRCGSARSPAAPAGPTRPDSLGISWTQPTFAAVMGACPDAALAGLGAAAPNGETGPIPAARRPDGAGISFTGRHRDVPDSRDGVVLDQFSPAAQCLSGRRPTAMRSRRVPDGGGLVRARWTR